MRRRLRVVVAGMVAGVPGHGGATWAVLQWVLGLRALGHDVLLVEQANASPKVRIQFRDIARSFGLVARAAVSEVEKLPRCGLTRGGPFRWVHRNPATVRGVGPAPGTAAS